MRREITIASSTHIDAHSERMSIEALESMVAQIRSRYVPVMINHDLRYPTAGRVVDAKLVPLPDGETALVEEVEYWDASDTAASSAGDGRRIPLDIPNHESFGLTIDLSFRTPDGQRLTQELAEIGGPGTPVRYRAKKAFDPVSWLVLEVGPFVAGGIALGVLGKIGADAYDRLKDALARRADESPGSVLDFNIGLDGPDQGAEVHILVSGPGSDVRDVFEARFAGIDETILELVERNDDVARAVVLWKDGSMTLAYALRSDGYPIEVNWDQIPALPLDLEG